MRKELVELHGAVFLFGFAGLFGKIISLPAMMIVLGRVVFAAIFLFLVMIYRKDGFKVPKRDLLYLTCFRFAPCSTLELVFLFYTTINCCHRRNYIFNISNLYGGVGALDF